MPLTIIVVEPHHAGNIGSICRACKTMGVSDVIVVNPQVDYLNDADTFRLGWASRDLIEAIQIVPTLEEALKDVQLAIATTHKRRTYSPPIFTPKEIVPKAVQAAAAGNKVAFVFGRENHGLSETELNLCHMWSSIPAASMRPALNLSQSVMLYAYEWFSHTQIQTEVHHRMPLATHAESEAFYQALTQLIPRLSIETRKGDSQFVSLIRRILGRTFLEKRDISLLFKWLTLLKSSVSQTTEEVPQ